MDYAEIRSEAIDRLQTMAGATWTDFNSHDPGITILEQIAYVLSDLLYRNDFTVPDLLASSGDGARSSLVPPEDVLPCDPVTSADLRRLVLDVPGVRNAWIEPAGGDDVELHHHPGRRELRLTPDPPASTEVTLAGLFTVLIEPLDPEESAVVRARVARTLYAHRPICVDFVDIRVLEPQLVQVAATVEIGPVDDPDELLLEILGQIAEYLAPTPEFTDPAEAARSGVPIDRIFDGPRLQHGYLPVDERERIERRNAIRTSDLVHAITRVPGVRAVTRIDVAAGGRPDPWSVDLDPDRAPQLDLRSATGATTSGTTIATSIEMLRGGLRAGRGIDAVKERFVRRRLRAARPEPGAAPESTAVAAGRDRSVASYHSIQHGLPPLYGVGEMGLPPSATAERRAQAKQLQAYLLLFDQLLANMFAQLAHAGELFSFRSTTPGTYFAGVVDDEGLALDEVRDPSIVGERLASLVDPSAGADVPGGRRDRFLTHLLARFAEELVDSALVAGERAEGVPSITEAKEAFLTRYTRVSGARGTAGDDLGTHGPDDGSGLGERIRRKLGLSVEAGEDLLLVEHILLRPTAGDVQQEIPLVTEADVRDPYSLRISFVLPAVDGRMRTEEFQRFVHRTIRDETPAHIVAHVHWLEPTEWDEFRQADHTWRGRRRRSLARRYGLEHEDER